MVYSHNAPFHKEFAYATKQPLRGYSITYKEEEVLLVIKSWSKTGRPVVAFIAAPSEEDCWFYFYQWLTKTGISLKWREDKFLGVDKWGNKL